MTALLVNPPALRGAPGRSFFEDQKRNLAASQYWSMPMEHLGLMSILASCRHRGIDATYVDGMVSSHRSVQATWAAMVDAVPTPPEVVGFSNIDRFGEVVALAHEVRSHWPSTHIVLGNVMATLNHERIFTHEDCFDSVVLGEGEVAFPHLVGAIADGRSLDEVPSLAWRADDGTIRQNDRAAVDLDELPFPARDELPSVLAEGFAAAVFTSRGCPYRCTFCGTGAVSGQLGRDGYRERSVELVVDELEQLATDWGLSFVTITDDLFVSKHERSQERARSFAHEVLRRGLDIRFMLDARVDSLDDPALFQLLKQAGLLRIFVGIETGSAQQLHQYRKQLRQGSAEMLARLNAVEDLGVDIVPGTIMFHPTVEPAELRLTAQVLMGLRYRTHRKFMDRITAYPGTPLYDDYARAGLLTSDWPLGEWEFADPATREVYDDVVAAITSDSDITFDAAAAYFLERVDRWDAERYDEALVAVRSGEQ